jgi:drug/metabolite transporter (DMT)-like permease
MLWLLFLLLTIVTWGSYNLFFKSLGTEINYFLALLIIGILQVTVALPFVIYYHHIGELVVSVRGYGLSALMGLLLGLGTIFFFYTFRFGASASIAIPVYGIGALLIGAVVGILVFNEAFNMRIGAGFALGIVSIILLTVK